MAPLASIGSVMAASTASTRLRGPLIVIEDGSASGADLVARSEVAESPWTYRDLAGQAGVKHEVELVGNHLDDFKLLG